MDFLKSIFSKYTGWIKGILLPLGAWGVFGIAFVDSAAFGVPMDPVIVGYVWQNPDRWWLYAFMGSIGSALGSIIVWAIGYKGGELLLEKRIGKKRIEQLRDRFEKQEFFALMVPAMLPPPTPFKMFVLAAGVFEMKLRWFISAIFVGRMLRFSIVSFLTIQFGPHVVQVTGQMIKDHKWLVFGVLVILVILGVVYYRARKQKMAEISV